MLKLPPHYRQRRHQLLYAIGLSASLLLLTFLLIIWQPFSLSIPTIPTAPVASDQRPSPLPAATESPDIMQTPPYQALQQRITVLEQQLDALSQATGASRDKQRAPFLTSSLALSITALLVQKAYDSVPFAAELTLLDKIFPTPSPALRATLEALSAYSEQPPPSVYLLVQLRAELPQESLSPIPPKHDSERDERPSLTDFLTSLVTIETITEQSPDGDGKQDRHGADPLRQALLARAWQQAQNHLETLDRQNELWQVLANHITDHVMLETHLQALLHALYEQLTSVLAPSAVP